MDSSEFFNILDYIYIGVMLLSAIVGLFRGFSRDFFGTCAWLLSGFLSVFAAPMLYKPVGRYVTNELLLRGICLIIAFLALLAIFLLMTGLISSKVKDSVFSGVDRAAGTLFGLFRGICVIFSVCLVMLIFEVPQDRFEVVRDSKISSIVFAHAGELVSFLEKIKVVPKGYINQIKTLKHEVTGNKGARSVQKLLPKIIVNAVNNSETNKTSKKSRINRGNSENTPPRENLSLSEAIMQRRLEKQQESMVDDREAD